MQPWGSQPRFGVIFTVFVTFFDNMYSWFTFSRFKWLLVEVLTILGPVVLYKEGTLVSHVGQSGFVIFWTSMTSLVSDRLWKILCKILVM